MATKQQLLLNKEELKELKILENEMLQGEFLSHNEVFGNVHAPVSQTVFKVIRKDTEEYAVTY